MNEKSDELIRELHGLKDAMVENLDRLIERDGKIEVILQKAESLSTYSKTYRARVSSSSKHPPSYSPLGSNSNLPF